MENKVMVRRIAAVLFVLLLSSTDYAVGTERLRHISVAGSIPFTVTIPGEWQSVPTEVIQEAKKRMQALAPKARVPAYACVLQESSEHWFTYPYIVMQMKPGARGLGRRFHKGLSEQQRIGLDKWPRHGKTETERLLKSMLSEFDLKPTYYDTSKHILWMQGTANLRGVGRIKTLGALKIADNGLVQVFCYSMEQDFDRERPVFKGIIGSIKFLSCGNGLDAASAGRKLH